MPAVTPRPYRAPARALMLAAVLLAATILGYADTPAGPDTKPPAAPDQVLTELRAANRARGQLQTEKQAWDLEKAKLTLLADTVRREAKRLAAEADRDKAAQADLGKQAKQVDVLRRRLENVEAVVDSLCERLEKATDALAGRCLPGLVPPDTAAEITDPTERLAAAVARLEETDRRTRSTGVELVAGQLDGISITVRLLRLGGVAAWWVTLDGKKAGWARQADGKLQLTPAAKSDDADAIRRALAMTEGRAAPDWALLPLPPKTSPAKEGHP